MKRLSFALVLLSSLILLSGCTQKNRAYETNIFDIDWSSKPDVKENINQGIEDLSEQLLKNSRVKVSDKIAITSFVDLHQLNKTTHFGRKFAESMYNELHIRHFNVVEPRGSHNLRVNANGEFFITRDIRILNKKRISNTYVLVGTYSKFGKGILINARIIDNLSGDVVSSARTIIDIDHCDVYENCSRKVISRTIGISDAGCTRVTCPQNCVTSDCYKGFEYPLANNKFNNKSRCTQNNCK